MIYTTIEAISNRLRGRLTVGGPQVPFKPTTVDDNLLEQVGTQVESRVNAALQAVYTLPIKTPSNPILASIVEKGVVCELLGTHYAGPENNPQDGYGRLMCRQFQEELNLVIAGAVPLDGETLISETSTTSSNVTITGSRKPLDTRPDAMNVQW